jgi:hypothetical protein
MAYARQVRDVNMMQSAKWGVYSNHYTISGVGQLHNFIIIHTVVTSIA